MLKTLKNAWKIPELRKKLLMTVFIVILYRLGAMVPVPFINSDVMSNVFGSSTGGSLFQYMDIISGSAFSQATLFALSISPYITASIVIQLLSVAIPALERLSKQGEEGKKILTQWTRIITVVLGLITAFGYYMTMKNNFNFSATQLGGDILTDYGKSVFGAIVIIGCYVAGTALVMWLAEQINEYGIGNGISIILFANILAGTMGIIETLKQFVLTGPWGIVITEAIVITSLAIITFVVFITESERRLPVQYAKKVVGRKMYGGQSTHLPIKLNMSGVMPIIFANSIVALPSTLALMFPPKPGRFWEKFVNFFSPNNWFYPLFFAVLIVAFAYFYISISFNPVEVSNNLKKNGGFIPGIRPGRPTSDYITKVLNRIVLIGAFFLCIVAIIPMVANWISGGLLQGIAFGGSSLLIVVGVVLETAREIEGQMTMRHYKGFLE